MDRTDILLVLLHYSPIVGNTRLQKLPFLIEQEKKILPDDGSFNYEANKFGPASRNLYDDIEFLINTGFVEKTGDINNLIHGKIEDIENMKATDFLTNETIITPVTDENEDEDLQNKDPINDDTKDDIVYRLTKKGKEYIDLKGLLKDPISNQIRDVSNKHTNKSLLQLLQHVYTKFPDFTTESEIRDNIL